MLPNDGKKVWATVLLQSAIMHRKITDFNFSFFLLYLPDHYLLRSTNFATIAARCNKILSIVKKYLPLCLFFDRFSFVFNLYVFIHAGSYVVQQLKT